MLSTPQSNIHYLHVVVAVCVLYVSSSHSLVNEIRRVKPNTDGNSEEGPLILTSLIRQGKIEQARKAAEVHYDKFRGIKSYAAYLTVNERYNSNLFFWFFPSWTNYAKAPVVLDLEGGPGGASITDIFIGNGPFMLKPDFNLELAKFSWVQNHSVIYIDNPVGTGYSFTDEAGYARNETIIGDELYEALLQFFQLFPELQKNEFFTAGISYAGKYVPAVSYAIHRNNPMAKSKINLRGLFIGNGWCDPEHQTEYSDLLYQVGLFDSNSRNEMHRAEKKYQSYIRNGQWDKAFNQYCEILYNNNSLFTNGSGFFDSHNYLEPSMVSINLFDQLDQFLQLTQVKEAVHVFNATFHKETENKVYSYLYNDDGQSVAPWIAELLNHYKILFYNGQLDIMVAYTTTVNFLRNLNFSGAEDYKTATRHKWYVGTDLAGYVKQAGNLTEVLVRNASHAVMMDQPAWVLDLFTRFTHNLPFY